jgi:cupin 2 domain-containing protein
MAMHPLIKNLFADIPDPVNGEQLLTLAQTDHVRVERIVSNGQPSSPDFWYSQEEDEWVVLLQGSASLRFPDGDPIHLKPGDHLLIPCHVKHRVDTVSPDAIWLAVHCKEFAGTTRQTSSS